MKSSQELLLPLASISTIQSDLYLSSYGGPYIFWAFYIFTLAFLLLVQTERLRKAGVI